MPVRLDRHLSLCQTSLMDTKEKPARRRTYKIWHLVQLGTFECDEQVAKMVIIAQTSQEARELAADSVDDDDAITWVDRRKSRITELGIANKEENKTRIVMQVHYSE
jgi:hypothetical protein